MDKPTQIHVIDVQEYGTSTITRTLRVPAQAPPMSEEKKANFEKLKAQVGLPNGENLKLWTGQKTNRPWKVFTGIAASTGNRI